MRFRIQRKKYRFNRKIIKNTYVYGKFCNVCYTIPDFTFFIKFFLFLQRLSLFNLIKKLLFQTYSMGRMHFKNKKTICIVAVTKYFNGKYVAFFFKEFVSYSILKTNSLNLITKIPGYQKVWIGAFIS